MKTNPLVNIIIPTFDNPGYLQPCLQSVIKYNEPNLYDITIVNNGGHPRSLDFIDDKIKVIKKLHLKANTGWEGGCMTGLMNTKSDYVILMNDDVLIPDVSAHWIQRMLEHFKDPQVGAVGPSSNCVMGVQNIFAHTREVVFPVRYVIGFCVMLRRSAFEAIGGMDMNLSGGDDLDWSIRLRKAGYKILADKSVFIYHHGFKTGTRTMGDADTIGGWNSYEMTEKTNLALIKKHGLIEWFNTLYKQKIEVDYKYSVQDSEGNIIRNLVKKDKNILDLGCGGNKTLKRAKGVDIIPFGELIPTLEKETRSQANIVADVSEELPIPDSSQDAIIARHVLEHVIDPITVIENWLKKLKSGGRLIIAVPDQSRFNSIPMNLEHVHAFTPKSLFVLLSSMGMKDIKAYDSKNGVSFIMEATK